MHLSVVDSVGLEIWKGQRQLHLLSFASLYIHRTFSDNRDIRHLLRQSYEGLHRIGTVVK